MERNSFSTVFYIMLVLGILGVIGFVLIALGAGGF